MFLTPLLWQNLLSILATSTQKYSKSQIAVQSSLSCMAADVESAFQISLSSQPSHLSRLVTGRKASSSSTPRSSVCLWMMKTNCPSCCTAHSRPSFRLTAINSFDKYDVTRPLTDDAEGLYPAILTFHCSSAQFWLHVRAGRPRSLSLALFTVKIFESCVLKRVQPTPTILQIHAGCSP